MYAKIQKGTSDNFMLIEPATQITLGGTVKVSGELWDYIIAQEKNLGYADDNINSQNAVVAFKKLGIEPSLAEPIIVLPEPNYEPIYGTERTGVLPEEVNMKLVNVDGINYVTGGNIYIINDNGKTFQRV